VKRKGPKKPGRNDYVVGYGRPPKATQFKKGSSGNKKGRSPGVKNVVTLFREAMHQRVTISENGQRRKVTKLEASLIQLANKAAIGDPKAIHAIINMSRELGDLKLPDPSQGPQARNFTLKVFEKDLPTGKYVRVKPGTTERIDDDDE